MSETAKGLRFWTAKELMAANLPPETAEEAYRRGYRDGYIVALGDFYAALRHGRRQVSQRAEKTMDALCSFYDHALFAWQDGDTTKRELPPDAPSR